MYSMSFENLKVCYKYQRKKRQTRSNLVDDAILIILI
jgi:hypothetical protein